jgi:tRNA (adenine22-N1)-methyltransferase
VVIAGMGGMLAISVLQSHKSGSLTPRIVLQVQRDIYAVRKHLHSTGYKIEMERILKEGGKVYIAMAAVRGEDVPYTEAEYHFGRFLLKEKNPLLKEYIVFENNKLLNVLAGLEDKHSDEIAERKEELKKLIAIQREAIKCL